MRICLVVILSLLINFNGIANKNLSYLIISCSLSPTSHSAALAQKAYEDLKAKGHSVKLVDLRTYNLPMVDGDSGQAYENKQVKELHDSIEKADAIIVASPIYLNSVSGVTKNMADLTTHAHQPQLTGKAWKNKIVAFMGASGGKFSRNAFLSFINSLILDSKIIFVPTYVMASGEDFDKDNTPSKEANERIEVMLDDLTKITEALKK